MVEYTSVIFYSNQGLARQFPVPVRNWRRETPPPAPPRSLSAPCSARTRGQAETGEHSPIRTHAGSLKIMWKLVDNMVLFPQALLHLPRPAEQGPGARGPSQTQLRGGQEF